MCLYFYTTTTPVPNKPLILAEPELFRCRILAVWLELNTVFQSNGKAYKSRWDKRTVLSSNPTVILDEINYLCLPHISVLVVIKAKKHLFMFIVTISLLQKVKDRFLKRTFKRTLLNLKWNSYPEYSVYATVREKTTSSPIKYTDASISSIMDFISS